MTKAFNDVVEISKKEEVDLATAAFMLAIKRIAAAYEKLGLFP